MKLEKGNKSTTLFTSAAVCTRSTEISHLVE